MDETAVRTKPDWLNNRTKATGGRTEDGRRGGGGGGGGHEDSGDDEECEGEVWDTLSRSFRQAQSVLDQNRLLIEEVNSNHESKIPDNMVKNVGLIRKISGNISKVISIYSDLSISFSDTVRQRQGLASAAVKRKNRDGDGDGDDYDKVEEAAEDSSERVQEKSEMVEFDGCGTASLRCPPADSRLYSIPSRFVYAPNATYDIKLA